MKHSTRIPRRTFLKAGAVASTAFALPNVITAAKTDRPLILGAGEFQYEVQHDWVTPPDPYTWQTTHNVAFDNEGLLYVIHEGRRDQPDHPSIFVFDGDGKFVRAFGRMFQGGGHGLEVRTEGGEQFLYVTGYQHLKNFAKLTLTGEVVWEKHAPMDSGLYRANEDTEPTQRWGRDAFMPTNHAFAEDGGFYLADGYGAYSIHRYDKDGNWLSSFGRPGQADGEFNLPHGIWIDARPGRDKAVVVADRANARLQWFTLDGKHLRTLGGFILPANIDQFGEVLLVPDLSARVTLVDGNDNLIHLGEDESWREDVMADNRRLRSHPEGGGWRDGRFLHPHDACFDRNGNIIVAEWVQTGRITRLKRV